MRAKPIQHLSTGYAGVGFNPVIPSQNGSQIQLFSMRTINESGSPSDMAVLQTLSTSAVTVFEYTPPSTLNNVTSTLLAGNNISLFNATAGSGLVIQSRKKMQAFIVNVSANQSGANTFSIQYSNGSGFTNVLQTLNVPTTFNGAPSGQFVVFFSPGNDYAPGCGLTGTDSSQFQIRFTAVSAGTTCSINSLRAAINVQYGPSIANNASLEVVFSERYPYTLEAGESIVPFFEVASNNNKVIAFYQYQN